MEQSLYEKYLLFTSNELNKEELESFLKSATLPENQIKIHEWMDETWNELEDIRANKLNEAPVDPIKRLQRFEWKRWVAAASVILVIALGSYFLYIHQPHGQNRVVKNEKPVDIKAPATNRAMITLSDGRTVYLDSTDNGMLASQSGTNVFKTDDGQIIYERVKGEISQQVDYNTLTNPRGSKVVDMQLSDGSHVWLNAGSSITYPVAFLGNDRKVEMSGEAYFEITHDSSKPFYVTKGDMNVMVLGTHFNVNAYDDEEKIKVTLLEGSVKVFAHSDITPPGDAVNATILRPGQQAIAINNHLTVVNGVDLETVMAWKNGIFRFHDVDIEELMREIARWYDVDVEYKSKPRKIFRGGMPKNMSAAKVFEILEETGGVHFEIQGKKVIVMNHK